VGILGHNAVSFRYVPQEILNQIVSNGYCLMVATLIRVGVSFRNVPQEILHKLLRNDSNELKEISCTNYDSGRNIVSVLLDDGVEFTNIPQDLLSQMVANNPTSPVTYNWMIQHLKRAGVLFPTTIV
jgi:hypothetical protein